MYLRPAQLISMPHNLHINLAYSSCHMVFSGHPVLFLLSLWSSLMMKTVFQRNWHRRTQDIKRKFITLNGLLITLNGLLGIGSSCCVLSLSYIYYAGHISQVIVLCQADGVMWVWGLQLLPINLLCGVVAVSLCKSMGRHLFIIFKM